MPVLRTHKNTPRLTNKERAWAIAQTLRADGAEKLRVAGLIQQALRAATRQALARDDVREGKPQRRAFDRCGGRPPP